MAFDAIFQPLTFRHLTLKNRRLRSNVSGRFDDYDGSGTQARVHGGRQRDLSRIEFPLGLSATDKSDRSGDGLANVEHPLGCYDVTRLSSRESMIDDAMTVFDPPPFR